MTRSDEYKKVFGKGTAYPVGSPAHEGGVPDLEFVLDESMQPGDTVRMVPPGTPIGPVDIPASATTVDLRVWLRDTDLAGIVNRTLSLDPKNKVLLAAVEGREFEVVTVERTGTAWLVRVEYRT